jgi:hypothetical protein
MTNVLSFPLQFLLEGIFGGTNLQPVTLAGLTETPVVLEAKCQLWLSDLY